MRSSRSLIVSPDAEDDIRSILEYTLAFHGERRQDAYAERLTAAMEELTRFPQLGRPREEHASGLRGRMVGEHVIYYRVGDETVTIVRVLHGRMDSGREFGEF